MPPGVSRSTPVKRSILSMVGATPFGRDMLFDVPPELAQELQATGKAGSKFKIVNGVVKGRAPLLLVHRPGSPEEARAAAVVS